jgi:hypothetical protein
MRVVHPLTRLSPRPLKRQSGADFSACSISQEEVKGYIGSTEVRDVRGFLSLFEDWCLVCSRISVNYHEQRGVLSVGRDVCNTTVFATELYRWGGLSTEQEGVATREEDQALAV